MAVDIFMLTNVHHPLDQRIFYKEARSLAASGYRVAIIGPAPREIAGRRDGVEIEVLPVPASSLVGRLKNMGRLFRRALRSDARIFHFHDPELLLVGWALQRLGRRVVYDVHEHFPQAVKVRPWVPDRLRRPLSWLVDRVERAIARRLDGVVGVVDEQGARFAECPFVAVKNYPRLECFSPSKESSQPRFELIHLGSLSQARGGFFLLEIARLLAEKGLDFRLLCLGNFHGAAARERFMALREQYGLCEQVVWRAGNMPYEALGPLLSRACVGLIPGQVSEQNNLPFVPTKLFEYLACGLPVVASDLPSLRRFRDQGNWGYVVKADDAAAHAWAIAHLLKNPEEAQAMGRRGRQSVEQCWNWDVESEKLAAFYRGLLGGVQKGEWMRAEVEYCP